MRERERVKSQATRAKQKSVYFQNCNENWCTHTSRPWPATILHCHALLCVPQKKRVINCKNLTTTIASDGMASTHEQNHCVHIFFVTIIIFPQILHKFSSKLVYCMVQLILHVRLSSCLGHYEKTYNFNWTAIM